MKDDKLTKRLAEQRTNGNLNVYTSKDEASSLKKKSMWFRLLFVFLNILLVLIDIIGPVPKKHRSPLKFRIQECSVIVCCTNSVMTLWWYWFYWMEAPVANSFYTVSELSMNSILKKITKADSTVCVHYMPCSWRVYLQSMSKYSYML